MSENRPAEAPTLALSTKVEEDFISPLTAIRGSLEILRDYPDLAAEERRRFVDTALRECIRLEKGVADLSQSVYDAAQKAQLPKPPAEEPQEETGEFAPRIRRLDDLGVIEVDFSDFVFSTATVVNEFYDAIERVAAASNQDWYFLINHHNCRVWPEAWVAFAHRGKRLRVGISLGTVRYAEQEQGDDDPSELPGASTRDADLFKSRDSALHCIEKMKKGKGQTGPRD